MSATRDEIGVPDVPRRIGVPHALIASLRPQQWIKNVLVFGALIFSRSLFQIDAVVVSVGAFVIFCFTSSAVYLLNDLFDLEEDRRHPLKKLRPLAAGDLSVPIALFVMTILLCLSVAGGLLISGTFTIIICTYLAMNVTYSLGAKRAAILDVMLVALGFVLRGVGGATAISVQASAWLVICTWMLALLVSFGKRRHELTLLEGDARNHRISLDQYSVPSLDLMMAISAAAAIITYAMYTMSDDVTERFGSRALVITVPFVVYGVFRYLYLVNLRCEGGDPARLIATDAPTLLNGAFWVITSAIVIYGPILWPL